MIFEQKSLEAESGVICDKFSQRIYGYGEMGKLDVSKEGHACARNSATLGLRLSYSTCVVVGSRQDAERGGSAGRHVIGQL